MSAAPVSGSSRYLVLAAMIFAVAMTFIDQTIVSIAVPDIQRELSLTTTGVQWAVNAYLLTLAAFFAFGGRLADTVGHRKMVVLGVLIFAAASACCGFTPKEPRRGLAGRLPRGPGDRRRHHVPGGAGDRGAELRTARAGRALALFFGIAGGLTAIGPVLGGYLTEWTWRAIFWVNLPVAAIALLLIALSKPVTASRPAPMDYRGLALIASGVALSVFGFQQSQIWGWSNPAIGLCIAAGVLLLIVFAVVEKRTASPLIQVDIFRIRAFSVQNLVLGISMLVFVPVFFFSSEYAQISLGDSSANAGIFLLYFFIGFVIASQLGGRMLDRDGAKRPVVIGCVLAAVGFYLWAGDATTLRFGSQQWDVVLAGAGMGFMLTPASTDAVNRASRLSYGEATGITQTVRNYAASLGLAVLGTVLVTELRSRLTDSLVAQGLPHAQAVSEAAHLSQVQARSGGGSSANIPQFFRADFAHATQAVLYWMAAIMAVAAVVAMIGLRPGVQAEIAAEEQQAQPTADEPDRP